MKVMTFLALFACALACDDLGVYPLDSGEDIRDAAAERGSDSGADATDDAPDAALD